MQIMENYTKSTESACALTKNMEVSFSSNSSSSKASSSESVSSSVTVSDTDVSVPARKNTKLSTKSIRTSCTECICYSFFFENMKNVIKIQTLH